MPKLSSLPKATLVETIENLAKTNAEVREAVARLTEDPKDRIKSIKQEISGFRRRKKFVPYHQQRPLYKQLERLATSIKEDIKDPTVGVEVALLAYALDERLPYILDGSNGAIGMWFDGDLKPAFVHHAKQYPNREKLLQLLVPFVNADGYGLRQNIWDDAQTFLSNEEIVQLLENDETASDSLLQVKEVYHRALVKATGDPARFQKVIAKDNRLQPTQQLELARLYLQHNQANEAIAALTPVFDVGGPYASKARELAFEAYSQNGQAAEVSNIIDRWLQETRSVLGLEALIKKVGESHREDLQKRFRVRLEEDKYPTDLTVLAFLDLDEEVLAIQTFHRIDLSGSFRASVKELAKRLPTPEYALEVTLCLRRMTEETLEYAKSKYYSTAASNFKKATALAKEIGSYAQYDTHEEWVEGLRKAHGRKSGFWGLVG